MTLDSPAVIPGIWFKQIDYVRVDVNFYDVRGRDDHLLPGLAAGIGGEDRFGRNRMHSNAARNMKTAFRTRWMTSSAPLEKRLHDDHTVVAKYGEDRQVKEHDQQAVFRKPKKPK
jgi:hypothetical protein